LFVTHHEHEMPRCITHVLRIKGGRVFQGKTRKNVRNLRTSTVGSIAGPYKSLGT
jgi:hypothetical protein